MLANVTPQSRQLRPVPHLPFGSSRHDGSNSTEQFQVAADVEKVAAAADDDGAQSLAGPIDFQDRHGWRDQTEAGAPLRDFVLE
jgi:hypothetical protein